MNIRFPQYTNFQMQAPQLAQLQTRPKGMGLLDAMLGLPSEAKAAEMGMSEGAVDASRMQGLLGLGAQFAQQGDEQAPAPMPMPTPQAQMPAWNGSELMFSFPRRL